MPRTPRKTARPSTTPATPRTTTHSEPSAPERLSVRAKASRPRPAVRDLAERAAQILERLKVAHPKPEVELDHENAWQLLIATILAARSNDRTINQITPELFRRWPTPHALALADLAELEAVVKRSGFFHTKANAIRETSRAIVARFGGTVPATMEALTTLPGVARKTANVVLNTVFRIASGVIVDVHVTRLVARFGFTDDQDAGRIEQLLCDLYPKEEWIDLGHRILLHGRYVCTAKKPHCELCPVNELCPSAASAPAGTWEERARYERALTAARGRLGEPTPAAGTH